ncbi:hypothetical protein ClosIBUN13A_CONTIG25g00315 [Clostridium sp. IBUN13A]|nr:hypothetical protein ClosIBUN13A_CONTIG25g00315 [Clostridium sp. IBUN13A]
MNLFLLPKLLFLLQVFLFHQLQQQILFLLHQLLQLLLQHSMPKDLSVQLLLLCYY